MATINMILQGKGGVGKSLIASLLAQYFIEHDELVTCVDTDPVNATFAGYKAYNTNILDIMDGDDINPRHFDKLIEQIMLLPENAQMVVDNGAATFVPLGSYLAENEIVSLLKEEGHTLRLHSVITGGQAMWDTLGGLESLLKAFPDTPTVVWLNTFFGSISHNNKSFEEFGVYKNHAQNFESLIKLPTHKQATFGQDLESLLQSRMTFAEAQQSEKFPIMVRHRLKRIWTEIKAEMDKAVL